MEEKKSNAKLFVGNLTYKVYKSSLKKVTTEDLNSVFRAYGEIVDMKIIDKGRHVYAFVEFSSIGDAEEAFREYSCNFNEAPKQGSSWYQLEDRVCLRTA